MTSFNVLHREESVHRHLFLEASAGTGKTFAIENIVVRLITEAFNKTPLSIENILVVTFTKMAAGELKERIHSNLQKCLTLLKRYLKEEDVIKLLPDYLLHQVEGVLGNERAIQAQKRIEQALFCFDQAQIYTIHGFCWRMLKNYSVEAEISLDAGSYEDQSCSKTQLLQVIRDFLKYELNPLHYSPRQLKILMQRVKRDSEKLQKDLLHEISRGVDIEAYSPFSEAVVNFQKVIQNLKNEYGFEGNKILEDCLALTPFYKGLCNTNGKIHSENLEKFERFASLFNICEPNANDFDTLIEDGIFLLEAFDSANVKLKAKKDVKLHYPNLLNIISEDLEPIVSEVRNEAILFSRLVKDCQAFMHSYKENEEVFNHTDLLLQMRKSIDKPLFLKSVRENYSAVIIDEFQDTDPVQWEIFSQLFSSKESWDGHFHLIGDPKQSIYAFRQADIYTYLRAAEKLGTCSLRTLSTNFRSQPLLIDALNALFSSTCDLFSLPKVSESLSYINVLAGRKGGLEHFKGASLQFWEVRTEYSRKGSFEHLETNIILPAISKEIISLNHAGMRFNQFAILVADRYQEKRVFEYLKKLDIPVKSQKGISLSDSSAVHEMRDLLNGVLHYHSKSSLNVALACRLIGMTHSQITLLTDEQELVRLVEKFSHLQKTLYLSGFAKFYNQFMNTAWHKDGKTVLERLLMESDGSKFYREWQDLADLMIAEEYSRHLLPQGLIAFLDKLYELAVDEDERLGIFVDNTEDGVSLLTTHLSKGLEFDVVFALGLINRSPSSEGKLIYLHSKEQPILGAVKNNRDVEYLKYCEEIDAEKMRQLYVALTRAREKLYVPYIIEEGGKGIDYGRASPMELFLAKLNKPSTDYQGIYQRLSIEDGSSLTRLAETFPGNISLLKLNPQEDMQEKRKGSHQICMTCPIRVEVPEISRAIHSFTSLAQYKNSQKEETVPHDFLSLEKTEHLLPSSHETGILLHKIFELLPLEIVRDLNTYQELAPLITPFLQGTSFVQWEEVIAKIVFNALRTHLVPSDFCLAEIHPSKIYRESEFLYPCDVDDIFQEKSAKEGLLTGVVDMFFAHKNKFYLLDWKTNWLGPSNDYYKKKNMEEAMAASDYYLQAKIYCEAFKRYLSLFNQYSLNEQFGGIYYVFVRGVSHETGILYISNEALGLR